MEAGPPVEPRTAAASAGEFIGNLPLSLAPLSVKTGLDPNAVPAWIDPDRLGVYPLEIRELERLEIHLGKGEEIAGFQHVGNELRPLPIGSTLDLEHGVFAWLPGPGFLGKHDLVFIVGTKPEGFRKIRVSIDIKPKYSFKERSSSDD